MNNLFYGYDLRDYRNVSDILARHMKNFGQPPSILINKTDSESIPKDLGAEVDNYVLPHSILLEILEDVDVVCYCGHSRSMHDSDCDEREEKFWCEGEDCDCGRFIPFREVCSTSEPLLEIENESKI
jgi:hypothetical protein